MKKILFLTACLFVINLCAWGETLPKAYRSHNGQLTQYLWSEWSKAISEAETGDTVFFTSGVFLGDVTIDKPSTTTAAAPITSPRPISPEAISQEGSEHHISKPIIFTR